LSSAHNKVATRKGDKVRERKKIREEGILALAGHLFSKKKREIVWFPEEEKKGRLAFP